MQGLGYKEILEYLDGECSLEEAVYTLKRDTRHFAKRQLTWFRRENAVTWLDKQQFDYDEEKILEYMIKELGEKGSMKTAITVMKKCIFPWGSARRYMTMDVS